MTPEAPRPEFAGVALGAARASHRSLFHRIERLTASRSEGRVLYSVWWMCGDPGWDVVLVTDTTGLRPCRRCELVARGEGFMYRFLNAAGFPLYIGSALDMDTRLRGHEISSSWWPEAVCVVVETYPDIEAARQAEAAAIEAEMPIHNKHYNKRRYSRIGGDWHLLEEAQAA